MKDNKEKSYTTSELLDIFRQDLMNLKSNTEITIKDIKKHAPKGVNGEIEENSYLKVKQAQLEVVCKICYRFDSLINKIGSEYDER